MTEEQWKKIEKTLLPDMDWVHFRNQIERIERDNSTPTQRLKECDDRLWLCRNVLKALPRLGMTEEPALVGIFERQFQADEQTRNLCVQLIRINRSQKFMRQCDILLLWQSRRGKLTKYGKGPHADFYAAAHEAVFQEEAPGHSQIKKIIMDFLDTQLTVLSGTSTLTARVTAQLAAAAHWSPTSTLSAKADIIRPNAEKPGTES